MQPCACTGPRGMEDVCFVGHEITTNTQINSVAFIHERTIQSEPTLMTTFADRGCRVVSTTDPYCHEISNRFLSRLRCNSARNGRHENKKGTLQITGSPCSPAMQPQCFMLAAITKYGSQAPSKNKTSNRETQTACNQREHCSVKKNSMV
jgi:hypothetical protein